MANKKRNKKPNKKKKSKSETDPAILIIWFKNHLNEKKKLLKPESEIDPAILINNYENPPEFTLLLTGLRSSLLGERCDAIVKFPKLFEKFPFPILINSACLKLGELFRTGTNFNRLWIVRIFQLTERHMDKVFNVDEFIRKIFMVSHSNDPVARALTLRALGALAGIIPENQQVHHSIREAFNSHESIEVEAAIYAAIRFCALSRPFALSMCNKISNMIQGLSTPAYIKLQLLSILENTHPDAATASMVRKLCTDILPIYPAKDFVKATLHSLTSLSLSTIVDIPAQVSLALSFLNSDPRREIQYDALKSLIILSKQGATLWPPHALNNIIRYGLDSSDEKILNLVLDVAVMLVKNIATAQEQMHLDSPLSRLCNQCCYSTNLEVSTKAVYCQTVLTCLRHTFDINQMDLEKIVDPIESILLLTCPMVSTPRLLWRALKAAIRLCQTFPSQASDFILLLSSSFSNTKGKNSFLIAEAMSAMVEYSPDCLQPALNIFLTKLEELTHARRSNIGNEVLMLTRLIFQIHVGYEWAPESRRIVESAVRKIKPWFMYRVARNAARYGQHSIVIDIWVQLLSQVSSENYHFWLVGLEELSRGEAVLHDEESRAAVLSRLTLACAHYNKAYAAIKAATLSSTCTMPFHTEYLRLRTEMLQCLGQLVSACQSVCTSPPAAIASTVADTQRDSMLRSGHVIYQLRKSSKDLKNCSEQLWKLYQSSFDADPSTLYNIHILQQICVLMAYSLDNVANLNHADEPPPIDLGSEHPGLEALSMHEACKQINAITKQFKISSRNITHHDIDCLLAQVEIIAKTPLCIPRYFFQVRQSTNIKIALTPTPRVPGEPISVPCGTHLGLRLEGVLVHGPKPGLFRQVKNLIIQFHVQLQDRHKSLDFKATDTSPSLTELITPHKDFFTSQVSLGFPFGGLYSITLEISIVDNMGIQWRGGQKSNFTVKSMDDPKNASGSLPTSTNARCSNSLAYLNQIK